MHVDVNRPSSSLTLSLPYKTQHGCQDLWSRKMFPQNKQHRKRLQGSGTCECNVNEEQCQTVRWWTRIIYVLKSHVQPGSTKLTPLRIDEIWVGYMVGNQIKSFEMIVKRFIALSLFSLDKYWHLIKGSSLWNIASPFLPLRVRKIGLAWYKVRSRQSISTLE